MNYGTTPSRGFIQISEPDFLKVLRNLDFRRTAYDAVVYEEKTSGALFAEWLIDGRIFIDPSYIPEPISWAEYTLLDHLR